MIQQTHQSLVEVLITRIESTNEVEGPDLVSAEAPLEIQLGYGDKAERRIKQLAVTMRTPGNDIQLAAGFLLSEGLVKYRDDILNIEVPKVPRQSNPPRIENIQPSVGGKVCVDLAYDVDVATSILERNFLMTSSCGLCGKASLLALQSICPPRSLHPFSVDRKVLQSLPLRLRQAQPNFSKTGGLHGAGLFSPRGELLGVYEDVGRHNAVDKLLGEQFLADNTPLRRHILMLSGRVSFELVQKALMAGISFIAAIGAPSSLAVETARRFDICLVGFIREDRMNVYNAANRITGTGSLSGSHA